MFRPLLLSTTGLLERGAAGPGALSAEVVDEGSCGQSPRLMAAKKLHSSSSACKESLYIKRDISEWERRGSDNRGYCRLAWFRQNSVAGSCSHMLVSWGVATMLLIF
jgi:hypothetical protein